MKPRWSQSNMFLLSSGLNGEKKKENNWTTSPVTLRRMENWMSFIAGYCASRFLASTKKETCKLINVLGSSYLKDTYVAHQSRKVDLRVQSSSYGLWRTRSRHGPGIYLPDPSYKYVPHEKTHSEIENSIQTTWE